ncbi:MAG: putative endopeptidase [Verrucomicrobiales bacterium]|jgi:putative endopeptidase
MSYRIPLACLTLALAGTASAQTISGVFVEHFDKEVRAQDDFFKHVNGTWLRKTEIPADKSRYASFSELADQAEINLRKIIDEVSASKDKPTGSDAQKVGDLYNSFMDEAAIEVLGATPIEDDLKAIEVLDSKEAVVRHLGHLQTLNVSSPVGAYVDQDSKKSDEYIVKMAQSGLGLPDRDYYLNDGEKFESTRKAYLELITDFLTLVETKEAKKAAELIFGLEKRLAEAQWSRVQSRDRDATYNKFAWEDLDKEFPGWAWVAFAKGAELPGNGNVIVRQPTYFAALGKILEETPLETWKLYMRFQVVNDAAGLLGKAFVDRNFEFFGKTLSGVEENRPRWKRAVGAVNGSMGEVLGKLYVERHFKSEAKERMVGLVDNLMRAFKVGIDGLEWMSAETKSEAQDKLSKFTTKIGYPCEWRDYSALEIRAGDLFGNMRRATTFEHRRSLKKLGQPVDKNEWFMTPQTVNAYYNPEGNEIVFPAAILQPPFFDVDAEDAINYGAIGGVIGHEISHGFDDQGRKYAGDGNLRDWWTEEDAKRFQERAAGLVDQFSSYSPLDKVNLNGQLTLGENIGDLAGITVAYNAYQLALNGAEAPVLDGFTGDQRFFIGWAQCFRGKYRDEELRKRLVTDPHSPSEYRVNGVMKNVPGFYDAFEVKDGDGLFLSPGKRVKIW